MRLEQHLKLLSANDDLHNKLYDTWKYIKRELSNILNNVSTYFPHFSLHNSTHSETILTQIERVLGQDRISKLSFSDTFALLLAAFSHDLGMVIRYKEVESFFLSEEYLELLKKISNDEYSTYKDVASRLLAIDLEQNNTHFDKIASLNIYEDVLKIIELNFRDGHAKRSKVALKQFLIKDLKLDSQINIRFINCIAHICELHQMDYNLIMELPHKSNGIANDYYHPRFIASMLCLGDLLDLDCDRFDKYSLDISTPMPYSSELHLKKHESVTHFLVCEEGIEIKSDTENKQVYRIMQKWVEWLEELLNFLSLKWSGISPNDFGNAPGIVCKELLFKNSYKWSEYSDLKFDISQERAIELLQGANIYRSKFVFLREIIQNAIDATLLHYWKGENIDADKYSFQDVKIEKIEQLKIKLKIEIENGSVVVTLRDKGIGISEEDIKNIANIGNTSSNSKNKITSSMPEWLKPSGAFGLGLQSIFLVADTFEIITKTENENAKKISFENSKNRQGYIDIEDYEESFDRGSEIKIKIDNSKFNETDLHCSTFHYNTMNLESIIYNRIFSELDNDVAGYRYKSNYIKFNDYFPVYLEYSNETNAINEKVLFNSIFEANKMKYDKILIENDTILSFKCYDKESMCTCKLELSNFLEDDEKSIVGDLFNVTKSRYSLFFKNEFVADNIMKYDIYGNANAILKNIDFSINILSGKANEILNIDRRGIKKDSEKKVFQLIELSLSNSVKKLIDKLVKEKIEINLNLIVKIFEVAKSLNYKYDEILFIYNDKLSTIKVKNYLSLKSQISDRNYDTSIYFKDLNENDVTFIIDGISYNGNSNDYRIIEDKSKVFWLNPKNVRNNNMQPMCLSHQIKKGFVTCDDDKLYFAIEVKPFDARGFKTVRNDFEKDEIYFLYDFLVAILQGYRVMSSNKKYLPISVLYEIGVGRASEYFIELIISNEQRDALKEYFMGSKIDFDYKSFEESIVNNTDYKKIIEFIAKFRGVTFEEVDELYRNFVSDIVKLIHARDKHKEIIDALIKSINSSKTNSFIDGCNITNKLYYNYYIV